MKHSVILLLLFCASLTLHSQTTLDRNDAGLRGDAGATSGFFQTSTPLNYPTGANSWWHLLDIRHTNTANNYAMQFSGSFFDQHLYFRKTNNSASQAWSRVLLETNGKVGIGTLTPAYDLDVTKYLRVGAQGGSDVALLGGGSGIGAQMKLFYSNGAENVRLTGNNDSWLNATIGNVGIGTASPNAKLEISSSTDYSQLSLTKNTIEGEKGSGIVFRNLVNNGVLSEIAGIQAKLLDGGTGYVKGSLSLYTKYNETKIEAVTISAKGNMGVGTATPNEKLTVNGKIRAKEIKVESNPATWPDYVFDAGYKVETLEELERYIKTNKHLPEMPSAKEVAANGVELGEMNRLLLKKVEELTLHLIEKDKQLNNEIKKNLDQDERIKAIEKIINDKIRP